MKKFTRIMTLVFYGLVFFTFFLVFVARMISIVDFFSYFDSFSIYWDSIISWILELGLSIFIMIISTIVVLPLFNNQKINEKKALQFNPIIMILYLAYLAISTLLLMICIATLPEVSNFDYSLYILLLIFELCSIFLFVLSTKKFENKYINKLLQFVAYLLMFIILCISSKGVTGIRIAVIVFMIFSVIAGAIYLLTYNVDFKNLSKALSIWTEGNSESKDSTQEKLDEIKKLYEQGYLTSEEYEQKRKEIIDSL